MADFEGKSLRSSIIIPRLKKIFPNINEESEIYNNGLNEDRYHNITAPIPTFNELIGALRRQYEKAVIEDYWISAFKWFEGSEEFTEKVNTIFRGLTYSN